jgi:hypothetical protein
MPGFGFSRVAFRSAIVDMCLLKYHNGVVRSEFLRGEWLADFVPATPAVNGSDTSVCSEDFVVRKSVHSHPQAALRRDLASLSLSRLAKSAGLRRYDVSTSNREPHVAGQHFYHNLKDLTIPRRNDKRGPNDIYTMVDVDYYVEDLDVYLDGSALCLYTFNPRALSGKTSNGVYWFESQDQVVEQVSGGEVYRHRIWNYDDPVHLSRHGWWFWPKCTVYNVDRVEQLVGENREFVLFTPRCTYVDPFRLLSKYYGSAGFCRKRVERSGNYLSMMTMTSKGVLKRSIKRVGAHVGVTVDETDYQAITVNFKRSKWTNIGDVEKYMMQGEKQDKDLSKRAALLFESLGEMFPESRVFAPPAPSYQVVHPDAPLFDNGVTTVVSGMPQLVANPAVAPVESYTNDLACVQLRVKEPCNPTIPPSIYEQFAKEFVGLMVGRFNSTGVPKCWDEVREQQDGPLQRQRAERTRYWKNTVKMNVEAFQKKEVYGKVNAPRNISTVTPTHTTGLSGYTYAFKAVVLKRQKWYYPCLDPATTVKKLRGYVSKRDKLWNTDYSSFDGTISQWLRVHVEQAAYLAFFDECYHDELRGYLSRECVANARTKQGVRYKNKGGRLSGSPLTTDGNTMMNAFASYCGYRLVGLTPERAYAAIGPKYGDDSIEDAKCDVQKAADELGLKLKREMIKKNEPCPFLGRIFVDPWVSDLTVQDPIRTLRHLHITVKSGVADDVALRNRVCGYLVTDSRTPIISQYCNMVKRILGAEHVKGVNKEVDRRVSAGPWPQPEELEGEMYAVVAGSVGTSASEVRAICDMLDKATTFEDVPVVIRNVMKVGFTAVVDGKLMLPN